ncbi:MAG: xanthine dehydrogenase accessory protein XdhC, partial [Terricaulis sp.]
MERDWAEQARARVIGGEAVALVTLTGVKGSAPREAGAQMLVWRQGQAGTIGGGNLEFVLTRDARSLLSEGRDSAECDYPLGPILGQCCGGRVAARIEALTRASVDELCGVAQSAAAAQPALYLFGAGHVGEAMARAMAPLPFQLRWRDTREAFCGAARLTDDPRVDVATAPAGSFYLVLTHNHDLDYEIVRAVLARDDAAYCGLIGSRSKRVRFERQLRADGLAGEVRKLTCPIGGSIGLKGKSPAVIAAATIAEVLLVLEARQARAEAPAYA